MARLFTLREAQRILPEVSDAVHGAMRAKQDFENAQRRLASTLRDLSMLGGVIPDTQHLGELRAASDRALSGLKMRIATIEEYGCLLKDLDIGLIDFLTTYQGREVCLCWKAGEDGIHFWHGADEGYRGRKPIDDDFIAGHSGGEPSGHA
ncbi:MAG TPA: DUF2203 domain-containing protein [Bryobacteraceae bacterium]|nr:DUF2203 domain-containing protein [Bryobacteraceae bacterium]